MRPPLPPRRAGKNEAHPATRSNVTDSTRWTSGSAGSRELNWVETLDERRRRFYKVTPDGRRVLAQQRKTWETFVEAVRRVTGHEHAWRARPQITFLRDIPRSSKPLVDLSRPRAKSSQLSIASFYL
jgi:hypothetical protein